jgi:hypothetical protein
MLNIYDAGYLLTLGVLTDLGVETKTNPPKFMSEVHLLVLNYEIVHQGTGFETVYVYI